MDDLQMVADLHRLFPVLKGETIIHGCCSSKLYLQQLITHWNDYHEYSFNEIADKLDDLPIDLTAQIYIDDL